MRNGRCGAAIIPRHVPEQRTAAALPGGVCLLAACAAGRRDDNGAAVHRRVVDGQSCHRPNRLGSDSVPAVVSDTTGPIVWLAYAVPRK